MNSLRLPQPATDARAGVLQAVQACEAKKAADIALLELEKGSSAFTDYFVVCSGSNPRQIQAISDEVEQQLSSAGFRPTHVEGYRQADWVLLDYVDFVVHIFSESARKFYDLERLWKSAKRVSAADLAAPPMMARPARRAAPQRRAAGSSAGRAATRKTASRKPRPQSRTNSRQGRKPKRRR
ncbi:MAG TPA: ribosome silencing factor [Terriglobales bacterium]|nr:ribosome silencing factor [Terriglobales bacterium]